jgi:hypothetical protein
MLETALYVAMTAALCGAITGNRVSIVLLVSVAYCLYLDWAGFPFDGLRWLVLDVSAMTLVAMFGGRSRANCAIFGLFFVGWGAYFLPDPYRYAGSMLVTILQLLLTFPLGDARRRLAERWKANFQHRDEWTNLESRGFHG